jgi:uncharacterized protein YozE (UPF0346 family)
MSLTFKEWLSSFQGTKTEIGAFANEVAQDPSFPEENDFHIIFDHVMKKTSDQIEQKFLTIWEAYQRGL